MARRSGRSSRRRVVITPTLPKKVLPNPTIYRPAPLRPAPLTYSIPLTVIEDRRQFHPSPGRSPRLVTGAANHTLKAKTTRAFIPPTQVMFDAPSKVLVCVRRKVRRGVLHALKKTGKGGMRKPRRNFWSSVSCR